MTVCYLRLYFKFQIKWNRLTIHRLQSYVIRPILTARYDAGKKKRFIWTVGVWLILLKMAIHNDCVFIKTDSFHSKNKNQQVVLLRITTIVSLLSYLRSTKVAVWIHQAPDSRINIIFISTFIFIYYHYSHENAKVLFRKIFIM